MVKGDHLCVDTKWPLIKHHGIDMGDGTVIHFFRDIDQASIFDEQAPLVISRTKKKVFCDGRQERVIPYRYCLPPDQVVAVAEYFLMLQITDGLRDYNLREYNCEHFATLCKIGRQRSRQAEIADNFQAAAFAMWALVESLPF